MRKGFTLIELLIVITIMAILAGAAVPYVQDYVEDARIAKAREDLGELRNAIMRYEVERGKLFDPVKEGKGIDDWQTLLVGPFLTNALTDPWGRPYYFSHACSMVFSAAEDGDKNTNIISVDCRPAMAPTRAWWYDIDRNGRVSTNDYIDVKFTRPIGQLAITALKICATSSYRELTAADADVLTSGACANVHPKGQNWVRLQIGATPGADLMAGSLIVASGSTLIFDASANSIESGTQVGLYTEKIAFEKHFTEVPTTASQAVEVPVSIKAAQ